MKLMENISPKRMLELWKIEDDSTVIANSPNNVYHFNIVASFIWLLCDGENNIHTIASKICNYFSGITYNDAIDDVNLILDGWKKDGLIVKNYDSLHPLIDNDWSDICG